MKTKIFFLAVVIAVMFIGLRSIYLAPRMDDQKATGIAQWLHSLRPRPTGKSSIKLPPQFSGLAANGTIESVEWKNGKLAYFLKSTRGFKGNYTGFVYVDPGFPFTANGAMDITGKGADPYLAIENKLSDNLYAVYSDSG